MVTHVLYTFRMTPAAGRGNCLRQVHLATGRTRSLDYRSLDQLRRTVFRDEADILYRKPEVQQTTKLCLRRSAKAGMTRLMTSRGVSARDWRRYRVILQGKPASSQGTAENNSRQPVQADSSGTRSEGHRNTVCARD